MRRAAAITLAGTLLLSAGVLDSCEPEPEGADDTGRRPLSGTPPEGEPGLADVLLPPAEGDRPDLLVISIDTLRRDHVGFFSGAQSPSDTPTIDRLLEEGVAFADHRSCSSWTLPSVVCALSGLDATESRFAPADGSYAVPDDVRFLADYLRDEGYTTGLVSTNPFMVGEGRPGRSYQRLVDIQDARAENVVDRGLALLDELKGEGEPWLLHLHFLDPHDPYNPPDGYIDTHALAAAGSETEAMEVRYRGEVRYLDAELGRLLDTLEERGDLEDTLVSIWSDHGEQFGEHGALYHGNSLYPEEVDTFAGFWGAGVQAQIWDGPTTHSDLLPATLFQLGVAMPRQEWASVLTGVGAEPRHALRVWEDRALQSVRVRSRELIYDWRGTAELYDRDSDPGDLCDMSAVAPRQTEGLMALLGEEQGVVEALYPNLKAEPIISLEEGKSP